MHDSTSPAPESTRREPGTVPILAYALLTTICSSWPWRTSYIVTNNSRNTFRHWRSPPRQLQLQHIQPSDCTYSTVNCTNTAGTTASRTWSYRSFCLWEKILSVACMAGKIPHSDFLSVLWLNLSLMTLYESNSKMSVVVSQSVLCMIHCSATVSRRQSNNKSCFLPKKIIAVRREGIGRRYSLLSLQYILPGTWYSRLLDADTASRSMSKHHHLTSD